MNHIHRLFLTTLFLLLLAACGGDAKPTAPEVVEEGNPPATGAESGAGTTFNVVTEESKVTYTVEEEFFSGAVERFGQVLGLTDTVGETQSLSGFLTIDLDASPPQLVDGRLHVDLRTLTSDVSRRDSTIRDRFLESNRFPDAIFVPRAIENFPGSYTPGESVTFDLVGDMTIREITNEESFAVTATLDGERLTGTAVTDIFMVDYGFDPPAFANMFTVSDPATITVDLVAEQ